MNPYVDLYVDGTNFLLNGVGHGCEYGYRVLIACVCVAITGSMRRLRKGLWRNFQQFNYVFPINPVTATR